MKPNRKDQLKKLEREILLNSIQATPGVHDLVLILDHLKAGYNIAKIFRTAEIFSLKKIYIVGTTEFNPYPAKGAIRRVPFEFKKDLEELAKDLDRDGVEIFVMDTHTDIYLHESTLPKKSAFIFGNEEMGPKISDSLENLVRKIKIKQFGKTESLNVSVAASIASYEYIRQRLST